MSRKTTFVTKNGPKAIGPYSTAVIFGDTAYLSGMGPMNPITRENESSGIERETRLMFDNIGIILNELGCSFSDVLKVTLYLTEMDNFEVVNEIYREYFIHDYPARTTVQVSRLPMNIGIEADMIISYKSK